jgi:hypothetical protein
VYVYSSSFLVEDSEIKRTFKGGKAPKKIDMCSSILNLYRFSRSPEDGRVILDNVIQGDNKIRFVPDMIMNMVAPKGLSALIKDWKNYIQKEHNGKLKPQ